jgi:putative tricarboxylic transport membrane protein
MSHPTRHSAPGWQTLAGIALALLMLALLIWLDASRLPGPATVGVGPAVAMRLVSLFVGGLGLAHGVVAWGRRVRETEEGFVPRDAAPATNTAALAWVLGGLAVLAACVELGGGFIVGATALFVGTARAFGQPVGVRSLGTGLGLTALVFLFFARVLSLSLPAGPLERWLQA